MPVLSPLLAPTLQLLLFPLRDESLTEIIDMTEPFEQTHDSAFQVRFGNQSV
jgi:hypothetical protein